MAPRLKTFITSNGLTDYVVAVSSRAKALDAWGSNQDLFKEGMARETDDPDLVAAAGDRPGEVLTRPAGGKGPITLPPAPKRPVARGPTAAQKRKVKALEDELAAQARAHEAEVGALEAEIAARRAKLDDENQVYETARSRLAGRLEAARRALRG